MSYDRLGTRHGVTYGVNSDGDIELRFLDTTLHFDPDDLHEMANDASDHEVTHSDLVAVDRDDLGLLLEFVATEVAHGNHRQLQDVDEAAQRLESVVFGENSSTPESSSKTMDLRRNTQDAEGTSYYAYDPEREEVVLGPFGSREYAQKCADRCRSWPWDLEVGQMEAR